MKQRNLDI